MKSCNPVIYALGLRQRWNLFAPDLIRVNQYSTALITYGDGSLRLYEWPRMENLNVFERFTHQKVRRFVTEFLARPRNKEYWPESARFVKEAFSDPRETSAKNLDKEPVQIEFAFNFNKIPEFKNYTKRAELPSYYMRDTVFVFRPEQKSLEKPEKSHADN